MKIYRLTQLTEASPDDQYCLGFEDLKTNAVYLRYGRLRPGEKERRLSARAGHEEIVCVVKGKLLVKGGKFEYQVGEGEAFHLKGEDSLTIENPSDAEAVYVAAGGRGERGGKAFEEARLNEPEAIRKETPEEDRPPEEKSRKQTLAS